MQCDLKPWKQKTEPEQKEKPSEDEEKETEILSGVEVPTDSNRDVRVGDEVF
jgi:hypothetical protein